MRERRRERALSTTTHISAGTEMGEVLDALDEPNSPLAPIYPTSH